MEDGLDSAGADRAGDIVRVSERAAPEAGPVRYSPAMPRGQVVEDGHVVAGRDEALHRDGTDISGTAGDEDAHGRRIRAEPAPGSTPDSHDLWVIEPRSHEAERGDALFVAVATYGPSQRDTNPMTASPALEPAITTARESRRRPLYLRVAGLLVAGALLAWFLIGFVFAPSRLVSWELQGCCGPAPAENTPTDLFVHVGQWPIDDHDGSWIAAPSISYSLTAVTITLRTSDAYQAQIAATGMIQTYDTGGWVHVHLSQPLGDRTLFDGSTSPPAPRSLP